MIKIIAAISLDRAIGVYPNKRKPGKLPWNKTISRGDLKYFHNLTKGNKVIMGRKTFQSIGEPLSDRENIVISRRNMPPVDDEQVFWVNNAERAIEVSETISGADTWVVGGSDIYKLFIPYADEIILTVIPYKAYEDHDTSQCVYFPNIDENFKRVASSHHPINPSLRIIKYRRYK